MGVDQAVGVDGVARVFCQIGHSQHGADASPLSWSNDDHADEAVFGGIDADRVVAAETVDAGAWARSAGVPGDGGFVLRDIDGGFVDADRESAAAGGAA